MASIYARGEVLWMKFKNARGKAECRSTGYRRGQETLARDLAVEVERQASIERDGATLASTVATSTGRQAAGVSPTARQPNDARHTNSVAILPPSTPPSQADAPSSAPSTPSNHAEPIGPAAPPGVLTVRAYVYQWLKRRVHHASYRDDEARFRLHVIPLIGDMALADVRPRHIRDLILALTEKTGTGAKCRNEKLAPRTVRLVFAMLRVMFKSAMIDEHIVASPAVLQKGVLPKNVDKDPTWRSTAIFEREELITIVSDVRIPPYRRMAYALEGIAGVRHGEMAGVRWSDYNATCEPLGKLMISRSGEKKRTKTQLTREIPVHPTLATLLRDWRLEGWAQKYGREPEGDDLIVPTEKNKVRKAGDTLHTFKKDLAKVGLRERRGHDLRRTFITLAQIDGARRDVLKPLTHPGEQDIVGLYTTFPWPVVCAEIAKLRLPLPGEPDTTTPIGSASNGVHGPEQDHAVLHRATQRIEASNARIIRSPVVAGYSSGYSPDCSYKLPSHSAMLPDKNRSPQLFRKP